MGAIGAGGEAGCSEEFVGLVAGCAEGGGVLAGGAFGVAGEALLDGVGAVSSLGTASKTLCSIKVSNGATETLRFIRARPARRIT